MTTSNNEIYNINWYPKESPEVNDTVVVRKVSLDGMGVWVELLEYGCKKGFIPLAYATKSNKGAPKTIKIGKVVLATVSRIDIEKKNIDLTRHSLIEEDVKKAEKRFKSYKNLMKLLVYISKYAKHMEFPELVENIIYPLHKKYENAYTALKNSYYQPEIIDELNLPFQIKNILSDQIQKMFSKSEVRIRCLFEAEIFKPEGVEILRDALISGYEVEKEADIGNTDLDSNQSYKKSKLFITIVAPPVYSITIDVNNIEKGIEFEYKVLNKIEQKINDAAGRFRIREKPKIFQQSEITKYQTKADESANYSDESIDSNESNEI